MKRSIDVIIVSNAKTDELYNTTIDSINTLMESQIQNINYNIVVMESTKGISYKHARVVDVSDLEFNYSKFLNMGRKMGDSEFVTLCNNDLIFFDEFWSTSIINEMDKDHSLMSACPLELSTQPNSGILPNTGLHYGYEVRKQLNGWVIFQKRSIYEKIGDLDEQFSFWYADNDYGRTLEKLGIKHALVSNSYVTHLGSKTLKGISVFDRDYLTNFQVRAFSKKWPNGEL
jgi:GT2 family glycosyltransferase